MGMMQSTPCTPGTSRADYTQDGPVAQRIASSQTPGRAAVSELRELRVEVGPKATPTRAELRRRAGPRNHALRRRAPSQSA